LHIVAGADHGFSVRKADGRSDVEVLTEIIDVLAEWAEGLMPAGVRR
jgi:hypothetical protein